MNNLVQQQTNDFSEFSLMNLLTCSFKQGSKSFHQVHMNIKCFTVASLAARPTQVPVTMKHFPITTIQGIGTMFLQKIEHLLSILYTSGITCCKRIFTQRINSKTMSVYNFLIV